MPTAMICEAQLEPNDGELTKLRVDQKGQNLVYSNIGLEYLFVTGPKDLSSRRACKKFTFYYTI